MRRYHLVAIVALLALGLPARAGLYYSGETLAELPSQWRGFLLDQRGLRVVAVTPTAALPPHPNRVRYEDAAAKLQQTARERKLTADEAADLGALFVRLGEPARAVELLRTAQREHSAHFRIAANLGTAWQLHGDPHQAAAALEQAVRLAPGKLQRAEELHLKLLRLRQRTSREVVELDDLFGVRYVGPGGRYEAGKLDPEQARKLPSDAVALVQQLALWLPADGRLLWQLAELANVHGDVRTAAAMLDGCVNEFGLNSPELRRRRQVLRAAADELAKAAPGGEAAKTEHGGHVGVLKTRSTRPLVGSFDAAALPAVRADAVNVLPWAVLAQTTLDRKFRPTFARYLHDLEGKQVMLTGFMQPLGDELEAASFMLIEYPVGCWYCEVPEATGIVFVELPPDKTKSYTRNLVKVVGRLTLNATDPENFLYLVGQARVVEAD